MSTISHPILLNDLNRFHELQQFLDAVGEARHLLQPEHLTTRLNVLDELDTIIGDLDPGALTTSSDRELMARAQALISQFEAANKILYQAAHDEIAAGGTSQTLDSWIRDITKNGRAESPRSGLSFDLLDEIVCGSLQLCEPRGISIVPFPEMTAYQPTPARHILDLIARSRLSSDDILVDLGSGLGHVPLFVSIRTGIRTVGIEVQPDHAASAHQTAIRLNLSHVRFVAEDARTTDLSIGTVFYMFTPFRGSILTEVLHRLHMQSKTRPIKICALGPCTRILQGQAWLKANEETDPGRIAIYQSR